jgi:mono/diheme cytochrome c family protein
VLNALLRRSEDIADKHIPLRIWWTLEAEISSNPDLVLSWLDESGVRQSPMFTAHLAGRIARRLAADRGDSPYFTRIDADGDWKQYANYPRVRMPGGKGDYTEWQTNYTPQVSDRNLTRLARLMETAVSATERDRMLAGIKAGLEQGATVQRVPEQLSRAVGRWWSEQPHTDELIEVAAHLGHPEALKAQGTLSNAASRGGERNRGTTDDDRGRNDFLTYCAPCHQTDGSGMARLAAPLRNSQWVLGRDDLLARIVLNGLKGELLMPPMATLDDQQLAAILTYIRRAWEHRAGPVSPDTVAQVRASSVRTEPWTVAELSALKDSK